MAMAATGGADPATATEAAAAVATVQAVAAGASTPTQADSTPARGAAVKDRECPYCHEFFTSSSLGRHLDQFIKEDKPKQPDGKHNVDEIQRLRGSVTRRQARSGSGKRNSNIGDGGNGFQTYTPTHGHDRRRTSDTPQTTGRQDGAPAAKRARVTGLEALGTGYFEINRPTWQSTGIISNVDDPDAADHTLLRPPRPQWTLDHTKFNFEEEQRRFAVERDEGRAAKLALTEVIDSIKASVAPSGATSPFDFDFLAQPFSTIVLHLLPSQRTIASAQVIPSADAWPIDPPDEFHLELVRTRVTKQLEEFGRAQTAANRQRRRRRNHNASAQPPTSRVESHSPSHPGSEYASDEDDEEMDAGASASGSPGPADPSTIFDPAPYNAHLENAWMAWSALSAAERTHQWHLSALRAFAQEQQAHEVTQRRLEKAEQQLAHQATQVRRLSSLQQPREYLLKPTTGTPLPPEAARKVAARLISGEGENGARTDFRSLNADALIAKWTPAVRNNRSFQKPLMSILEAAAAAVGGASAQQRNGDPGPLAVNGVQDDARQNGDGNIGSMDESANAASLERLRNGAAYASASGGGGQGAEGNSADASGEEEDGGGGGGMVHGLVSNGMDTDMLDPTLRAGDLVQKDDGEFGAESLLAKVGASTGTLRKRRR